MVVERKTPEVPEGATRPTAKPRTRTIRVRLDQLVLRPDDYAHRDKGSLDRGALRSLLDSIKTEGLRHAPECYAVGDGTFVIVTGHRRVTCLILLAQDSVIGFSMEMEVDVVELLDTTLLDRMAWSVADNEVRLSLTAGERFAVVMKFVKAGMPDDRGAYALGLSVKQYQRDLALVRNEWMLDLVNKNAIPATTAVELLEVAGRKDRLMELKTYLEDWVAEMELKIESEGIKRELKPAEKQVRSRLPPVLKRHWLEQLASGKELDADAQKRVKVNLNPKTLQVAVQGFKMNLQTDPVEDIARVLGMLSQIAKTAAPILKTRVALEGPQGGLLNAMDAPQIDADFIKNSGMEGRLDQLPTPEFENEANSD